MRRLQVGDDVVVIRGNHKGKRGKVRAVLPEKGSVVVEGVNAVKRHVRSTPQRPGGIIEIEAPIHASKVMPLDPETGGRTRVRCKGEGDQKVRVAKSGATISRRVES